MKREFKHILQWIAKRSILFVVVLIFAVAVLFLWFLVTGFSQSQVVISIGIAAISAFFAAISSIASLLQAVEIQRQRENQERPYVITYFDGTNRGGMYIVIENRGNSPAINVSFEFIPTPIDFAGRLLSEVSIFKKPISFLPPGKSYRQIIDAGHKFLSDDKPSNYQITTIYSSVSDVLYKEKTDHDLSYLKQATVPGKTVEENLEDISKILGELSGLIKNARGMNSILVETPDQYHNRISQMQRDAQETAFWRKWFRKILERILSKL